MHSLTLYRTKTKYPKDIKTIIWNGYVIIWISVINTGSVNQIPRSNYIQFWRFPAGDVLELTENHFLCKFSISPGCIRQIVTQVQSSMVHACPPRPETGTGSGGATWYAFLKRSHWILRQEFLRNGRGKPGLGQGFKVDGFIKSHSCSHCEPRHAG